MHFQKLSYLLTLILLSNKSFCSIPTLQATEKVFEEKYTGETLDFLVLGDWGYLGSKDEKNFKFQKLVADSMEYYAHTYNSSFIVNVGDNFYKSEIYDYQGVKNIDDEKWVTIWQDVYTGRLSTIPWYSVAGNHDWYNNITAEVDYSNNKNSRFFLPSLFYVRTSIFGPMLTKIAWIHIDSDIFYYDYNELDKSKQTMKDNFLAMGWDKESAVEDMLKWIEERLIEHQDAKWIFAVAHHPLIGECAKVNKMYRLQSLFESYRVTAFFAGHNHVLEYQAPKDSSPVANFISGAGSRLSEGCVGKDWGIVKPGFLHASIGDKNSKMEFEFIDASDNKSKTGKVAYQGEIYPRPFWYPKI